jgi:hypothetical protein
MRYPKKRNVSSFIVAFYGLFFLRNSDAADFSCNAIGFFVSAPFDCRDVPRHLYSPGASARSSAPILLRAS